MKRMPDIPLTWTFVILALVGCAANSETSFFPHDEEGQVGSLPLLTTLGEKSTVTGIDVWENGIPDRGFEEIGRITNDGKSDIFARSARLRDVARVATYQGADAVILLRESEGTCTPNNIGGADCTSTREYAVIRYTK